MSYMQNYVPSATAFSANQDDSAANSDAPTSFFYDAWAGSSSQAHAPYTSSTTFATLASYGHDHATHAEMEPHPVTLITGPIMESYKHRPMPLLDFTSLETYQDLVPDLYCEPYVHSFQTKSTQNWSELRAAIERKFLPSSNSSEYPFKLIEQMTKWEEEFSTGLAQASKDERHPLLCQFRLKSDFLAITQDNGLPRDIVSKAAAILDMVLARSVNAMPIYRKDIILACLRMAVDWIFDDVLCKADERGDMTKPFEESGRYLLETLAIQVEDRVQARRKDDIMSPENRLHMIGTFINQWDWNFHCNSLLDWLLLYFRNFSALTRADPQQFQQAGVPNLPMQTLLSAFYLHDSLMFRNEVGDLPYSLLAAGIFKAVTAKLTPVAIDACLKYTGYTDKQMCRVTKLIQDKFPDHRYARLSYDGILMNQCRFNVVVPLFDDEEDVGMAAPATFEMLVVPRPEDDEVAWVLEPIPEDAPYPAEPVRVIEIQWNTEEIAAATARLMDSDAWKQDDWEEEDGKEDEEVDQEVEELREPIPEDAPYPAEPTVVATPWQLEEMAAATVMLMESKAWKVDNWGGELFKVQPIPADAPYPPEPTGVIVGAWDAEEIAAASAKLMESDAWKADDDWDLEMEEEEELNAERIPEDVPYPAEPTGMVVGLWEEAGFAAATARLLESKEWMEDEDWDMDAEERVYAAATAELLAEDWEDTEEGKEEGEEEDVYVATAEFLAEDWDEGMEVDDWEEMDWEETDL
ncbi:hypothetical protein HDU77_006929 [Chytriomyces hyalinus]|nr:hypothetical protein HDU77_006929 [Chytriomyces hyalinus]